MSRNSIILRAKYIMENVPRNITGEIKDEELVSSQS